MKTIACELPSIVPCSSGYCKGEVTPCDQKAISENRLADVSAASETGGAAGLIAGRIPCDKLVVVPPSALPVSHLAGLDKLEVSCWVSWDVSSSFTTILEDLAEARDELRNDDTKRDVMEVPYDFGNGISFNLGRLGAGKYPFVLKSADITILLSHHSPDGRFPNCRLEVGSMSCWQPGWQAVWAKFLSFLGVCNGSLFRHNVRRADLTVDLLGCDFAETGFIESSRWVCRGSGKIKTVEEHYIPSYKSFGKGAMMMRLYDKTMSLKEDAVKASFFWSLWAAHLGSVPDHVTRTEFQMCRNVLRTLQVHTMQDLEENLDSLWLYCVGSQKDGWARFCDRNIPAHARITKNQDSYEVDQLWEYIRSVRFSSFPAVKLIRERKPKPRFDFAAARKRVGSAMLTVCAAWGVSAHDHELQYKKAVAFVCDSLIEAKMDCEEYLRKYKVKQNLCYTFGEYSEADDYDVIPNLSFSSTFVSTVAASHVLSDPDSYFREYKEKHQKAFDDEQSAFDNERIIAQSIDAKYVWKVYGA